MSEPTPAGVLSHLMARKNLSVAQTRWAFDQIMDGLWSDAQIAAMLVALSCKGETVEEIVGAAQAMRAHAVPVGDVAADVVDTCGTGGTGISTFNISTAAAIVAAGAGAKVAKHGNRTNTRASGSANVLSALGVNIECDMAAERRCLAEAGVCFCFAVRHHPAMKYAAPIRKQLGVRTIFNVLGPLTNPAGARRQVMGVPRDDLTDALAHALQSLGAVRAMVVHGADGLDELSTTAPTRVAELANGMVTAGTLEATSFGLTRAKLDDLLVDSPEASAAVVRRVLEGGNGPSRDIVLLNAAAALAVAEVAEDIPSGLALAKRSLDSRAALGALEKLIAISNGRE